MIVGLVADDLTGAGDAAVQFARRGWETRLFLDVVQLRADTAPNSPVSGFSESHRVFALTTDARALSNSEAEESTAAAVRSLVDAGVDRVFLKIDSTMRGSVPGQIAGALAVWRKTYVDARAVVCPAYPRMGRTVRLKHLLVHGEPVERSPIGRDPVTPVKTSDMAALVPESDAIAVFDASTDADLTALATRITAAGPSTVAVGSGGLAEAVAEAWSADLALQTTFERDAIISPRQDLRMLVLVTSLNPVSRAQVERLNRECRDVATLVAPSVRVENASVARDMAARFADLVRRERWDVLGLVGGDGARAALRHIDASAIRIFDSLLEGIPLGVIVGGRADGIPVFTKAGGFGEEDALVRVVRRIRG